MALWEKVQHFVDSQQTLQFYDEAKAALKEVLMAMREDEYETVTDKLVLVALHEGAIGQVVHIPPRSQGFAVLQLTIPNDIPYAVLRWSIAHELGHVLQGRNWRQADDERLENDATERAAH